MNVRPGAVRRQRHVVVATNDGGATHPAWYFNLAASGRADAEVDGRRMDVSATELSGEDAARWWEQILEHAPDYERYTRSAGRAFPMVRLAPVADG